MIATAASALHGWRRAAVACALGVLATGALPPFGIWPLLIPAFSGLLLLLDGARDPRAAFWIGWSFGLGHFTSGLYWIANALLIDAVSFWWMVPFAALGLPAFLSLFVGTATAAWRWLSPTGATRLLSLAALWSLSELARGHLLTGFPWNLIGYGWWDRPETMQGAAVFGVYGLGFLTVLACAAPALRPTGAPLMRWLAMGGAVLPLLAVSVWGHFRLADAPIAMTPDVRLRLVQPNIPQHIKMNNADRIATFERLLDLSASKADRAPTAIIWPETATPFLLEREAGARAAIADLLAPEAIAIIGAPRAVVAPEGGVRYYNGLVALDADDLVRGVYDKFHLVPFGEYVPLRGILPIETIANRDTDYSWGVGARTLRLPGTPAVGPLICYEAIFPGEVLDPLDRPAWLLNLTNDAWYGRSTGPYQHFTIVAARAIEEGLPMVRVANSGVSGVIDPYGRVTAKLGLDEGGVIDAELPAQLSNPPMYTVYRNHPLMIVIFLAIFWAIWMKNRQKTFRIRA